MHKRMYEFFEDNNIFYELQFGFRKKMSTGHSLVEITEEIKESSDNGKFGCGIFIDLKKAFDTVNHQILLVKLEHYGIRGALLKWFESYLTDRKQYVYHNGIASSMESITCGVPQGSVLGPLLFLIYVNDLPNISDKLRFFLFADVSVSSMFTFSEVSAAEILIEINDLDEIMNIPAKRLKEVGDIVAETIAQIWNEEIINNKKFAAQLKVADITPLHKKLETIFKDFRTCDF